MSALTDLDRDLAREVLEQLKSTRSPDLLVGQVIADAREAGRQEILDELGVELLSHARAAADSLEGDLGLVRLIATRLTDYGVNP
jgi:hypothetical protein